MSFTGLCLLGLLDFPSRASTHLLRFCSSFMTSFTMSDAELVSETDCLEVVVSDLPKRPLTLPKEEEKEEETKEKAAVEPTPDKAEDKKSSSSDEEDEKKAPSADDEEEKEKGADEDVGSEEQELVKKVKEMSVAPVDDGVDFGHDALEATSSAEAELAPDPLKKPASSLPSSSACPAVPDDPMDSSLPASSTTSKEVLPSSSRQPKPPPYSIPDDLAQFLREKPLLRFGGAGSDSDAAACGPPPRTALPRSSSLKRPKSRGRSKSRSGGGDAGPSRSRTSPDRSERAKPAGCVPSSSLGPDGSPSLPPLPPMPDDPSSPTLKSDLLKWISLSLRRDWKEGAKAWVNLHVGLYLYEPSYKYSICHPRCLAACTVSKDLALDELFCCWSCNKRGPGSLPNEVYRTLWPTHTAFVWHWCLEHANPSQKTWSNLANSVGITASDLAFELLGVDLAVWPLPWKPEAVASLPKRLPPKKGGHSPKIAESPWFMSNSSQEFAIVPARSFNKPKPPSYPPPPSVTSRGNKIGPIRPLPKHGDVSASFPHGATSKSSSPVVPIQLDLPEPLSAAKVLAGGTRFNHQRNDDKTAMGWINPLKSNSWRVLIEREINAFIAPFQSIGSYTTSRTVWYDRFVRHSPLRSMAFALLDIQLPQRCRFLVCFTLLFLFHEWMLLLLYSLPSWPCPLVSCHPRPGL